MWVKVLGINLLLFVAYVALITGNSSAANKGFNIAVGMGIVMVFHVVVNGFLGILFLLIGKRHLVGPFLISAGALMPLGFITWFILLSIFG